MSQNRELRVAFPYSRASKSYDPSKIFTSPEYIFLDNIYSALVRHSIDGELESAIAERFEWVGSEAHFSIKNNLTTIDGHVITAEDAAFSLKRLLLLSKNTHGNLKDLICTGAEFNSITDACSGIEVKGSSLVLKLNKPHPFLFRMLASIDFAVIPKSSIDPVTLQIKDYRNTSGPYYVESDNEKGNIVLVVNRNHFNYSKDMPQKVFLVPTSALNSTQLFKEHQVDFLTTVDAAGAESITKYAQGDQEANIHSTLKVRNFALIFTPKGLRKLNVRQRFVIGKVMRTAFQRYRKTTLSFDASDQIFPATSVASLTQDQLDQLQNTYSNITTETYSGNLKVAIVRSWSKEEFSQIINPNFSNLEIIESSVSPNFLNSTDGNVPDMYIAGMDTNFQESIGFISYTMNTGRYGLSPQKSKLWLEKYTNTDSQPARIEMLKSLHFQTLMNGINIPLVTAPYVALARKPWQIEFSPIYAKNPLWQVKWKP